MSLKDLLLDLVDKGLASERIGSNNPPRKSGSVAVPSLKGREPMRLSSAQLSNAGLFELLDQVNTKRK